MKTNEHDTKIRRTLVFGSLFVSVAALLTKYFKPSHAPKSVDGQIEIGPLSNEDKVVLFISASRDAKNYIQQIQNRRKEYFNGLNEKYPTLADQLKARFDDGFWGYYHDQVIDGFYKDVKTTLSDQDLDVILAFFNSPAGQNYLKFKDLTQGPESSLYKNVLKVSNELSRHTVAAINNLKSSSNGDKA
jgi:hypothetical protein